MTKLLLILVSISICLPILAEPGVNADSPNEIKTAKPNWRVNKYNHFRINGEYLYKNQKIRGKGNATLKQNYGIGLEYKYRDPDPRKKFIFNPGIQFYTTTQNSAEIAENEQLNATFSPSYRTRILFEVENLPSQISSTFFGEFEKFSSLDNFNNQYFIRRNTFYWAGFNLTKYVEFLNHRFDFTAEFASAISSETEDNNLLSKPLGGNKYKAEISTLLSQNFYLALYAEEAHFSDAEDYQMTTYGSGIGYRF